MGGRLPFRSRPPALRRRVAPVRPAGYPTSRDVHIVRRTQLYLDDHLWGALHARARCENTTISELVRQAVRDSYAGDREQRVSAMQSFVGSRKPRAGETHAVVVGSIA